MNAYEHLDVLHAGTSDARRTQTCLPASLLRTGMLFIQILQKRAEEAMDTGTRSSGGEKERCGTCLGQRHD